jgi:carboxypeptidase T
VKSTAVALLLILLLPAAIFAQETSIHRIETRTVADRTLVAESGSDIHYVHPKAGWIIAEIPGHRMDLVNGFGFEMAMIEGKETFPPAYAEYHDYAEVEAALTELAQTYPAIVSKFSLGQSHEGRELWAVKISDNPDLDEPEEGGMLLVAQHHAREILSTEVALFAAQKLAESYGTDEMITALVDNREIFVAPTINPDGGEFDREGGFFALWRKNRRQNPDAISYCWGVDLNRNYGHEWGGVGSTNFPCDLTYRGPDAFSEPETQAVRDFVLAHDNIRVLLTLHSYSELVLWPWSYTEDPLDDATDLAIFETLGNYFADQNGYEPKQGSGLYPTTGDTTDWAYGELGIYAFTFELSPTSPLDGFGFYPKPGIIEPASQENFPAFLIGIGLADVPERVLSSELWKLEANWTGQNVKIDWASIVETEATGWRVLRREGSSGDFAPIDDDLIASGSGEYSTVDLTVEPNKTYEYKVQFVSNVGRDELFGPVTVTTESQSDDDDDDDDNNDTDAVDPDSGDDDDDDGSCCG